MTLQWLRNQVKMEWHKNGFNSHIQIFYGKVKKGHKNLEKNVR